MTGEEARVVDCKPWILARAAFGKRVLGLPSRRSLNPGDLATYKIHSAAAS